MTLLKASLGSLGAALTVLSLACGGPTTDPAKNPAPTIGTSPTTTNPSTTTNPPPTTTNPPPTTTNRPPTIMSFVADKATVELGGLVNYTFQASDPDEQPLSCK